MSLEDNIYRAVLDWLKAGCVAPNAAPLTDQQVIRANQPGERPAQPYLTVLVVSSDTVIGVDEAVDSIDGGTGDPLRTIYGERSGTVSVQGFGEGAYDWLRKAALSLRREATRILDTGLAIRPLGSSIVNLAKLLDTSFEARYLREFRFAYRVCDDPETLIELLLVEASITLEEYDGDPNALLVNASITV